MRILFGIIGIGLIAIGAVVSAFVLIAVFGLTPGTFESCAVAFSVGVVAGFPCVSLIDHWSMC